MKKIIAGAALLAGMTGSFVGSAGAACGYPDDCSPLVDPAELPAVVESAGIAGIEVQGKQQLPVTGTDAAGLAAIGAVLVAGGGLLVWRSKAYDAEA